jgi:hypothetical protein
MEPVQGVTVGMIPEGRGRGAGPTTTSDEAGKFRFANVPPGRYELVAPSAKPQALTLGRGQSLKDLRVQISGPLTISGRVLDENGAPVARAFVMATQPTYLPTGRVLRPCQAAQNARIETDDRGEYRLYGLEPGSYYVTVALKGPLVIGISGTPMPEASCITAFYPSAIDPAEAVPVVLKPGLDATGIDFRLRKIPLYVAKFKVVTAPGFTTNPALPPQITIARLGRNGVRATLQQGGIGTFEGDTYTSPALPEGSYELEYSKGRALAIDTARIRFTIIDRDVDAGTITMYPSVTVSGEIKTEGPMPAEWRLSNVQIGLRPLDVRDYVAVRGFRIADDGTFSTGNTVGQGSYQFYFSGLHENLYLATATRNGQDILNGGLVMQGAESATVALTLREGGRVEGVVRNAKDEPVANSMVALIPSQNRRGNLLLVKSYSSDQEGRFSLRGVAPGEYTLLAWEDAEANATRNAEFLKEFETRGVLLTVREGVTSTATARVIAAP